MTHETKVSFPKSRRQASPSPLHSAGEVTDDVFFAAYDEEPSGSGSGSQFMQLHDVLDTAILEDDEDEGVAGSCEQCDPSGCN